VTDDELHERLATSEKHARGAAGVVDASLNDMNVTGPRVYHPEDA
jgi:hypothetical protein